MIEFLREWSWIAPVGILLVGMIGLILNFRKTGHIIPAKWKRTKSIKTLTDDIVGRDEVIMDLYRHFYKPNTPIALTGIGGVGKTVLAEAFAKSHVNKSIFHDSILLPLGSDSEMAEKLERIGAKLDVPPNKNAAVYMGLVFDAMQASRKRYLLILDNADSEVERKIALAHIPDSEKISVLITSQYTDWRPPIKMVSIGPLSEKKALELIVKESGLPLNADLKNLAVKTLECLPLPITIVGADLRNTNIALKGYDTRFRKLLQETPNTTYEKSIYAAVKSALERLTDEAKSVIQIAAFLDPNDITEKYFFRGGAGIDFNSFEPLPEPLQTICKDEDDIKTALGKCATHSLLSHVNWGDDDTYRIHRTTQMVLRDIFADSAGEIAGFAARLGHAQLTGSWQDNTQLWPYYHRLARHAESLLAYTESMERDDGKHMSFLATDMDVFLRNATGDLERSIRLGEGALYVTERLFGTSSLDYSTALSNLANTKDHLSLKLTGTQKETMEREAELAYKKVIEVESKISGSELSLAATYTQLGGFYWRRKRFFDAERQCKTALILDEDNGAPAHLIATDFGNLGALYSQWAMAEVDPSKIKNYREKALGFKTRALAPIRIALGEIHPKSATLINNLAVEYQSVGEVDKALVLAIRAAAILFLMVRRGELSSDNPKVQRYKEGLEFVLVACGHDSTEAPDLITAAEPEIIAQHEKWEAAKAAGEDYDPPPILPPESPA